MAGQVSKIVDECGKKTMKRSKGVRETVLRVSADDERAHRHHILASDMDQPPMTSHCVDQAGRPVNCLYRDPLGGIAIDQA